ncbi:MAG: outer membrane protein transport protein [Nitrosomonadales bacterium]|nr:outer membrane protein transport protein [Nitrosomonadales bacterium]
MKQKIIVSMLVAAGLASPVAYATNGYFAHGYGTKAKGMGGVGIALPQDALAAATNPAGMIKVGERIDAGLEWFRPSRSASITGNAFGADATYDGNGKQNFFIPEFGYNHMLGADSSVGVSVYGNGGMNSDYAQNPYARFGATGSAGINLEQLFISPSYAKEIAPGHSLGIAVNLVYQRFSAKGLTPFTGMSAAPGSVTDQGNDSSTGVGLRLGWLGEISPSFSLGATYQPKTRMSKFSKYQGLFADQGSFDIPASYGVGMSMKPTPVTTLAVDVEVIEYSKVKSVGSPFASPGPLGSATGAGFGWKDVTVFKIGASHDLSDKLTVRAGYNHNNQPIPASETFFNILAPGVVTDHVTLGATWRLEGNNEISLAYMHAFKTSVNGVNSIPPGFPPAGMGGGNANLKMSEDSLGLAYSWKM